MLKDNWLVESFTQNEKHSYKVKKVLIDTETKFQKVKLLDLESYKKALVLDGEVQSTELDEFIYHESIVHPAMVMLKNPKKVLILGGGEGATLREVLKHKSIEKAVMVDIDGEVVEFCKKHLDMFHKGAYNDPRTELVIDDAKNYIYECEKNNEKFDLIISDLCCPVEGSPACLLYSVEFYNILKKCLKSNGILLVQSGPADIPGFQVFNSINATLKQVFANVYPYSSFVPSFIVPWGFQIAVLNEKHSPNNNGIDKILDEILIKNDLKYYDAVSHQKMFNMPKHLTHILRDNKEFVITENKPCFLFK